MFEKIKRLILGEAKDIESSSVFHKMSLVALLAWVGLGADGLSSSAYGPEEIYRAFESGTDFSHYILPIALIMIFTIFIITATYCQVVKIFPSGGGGYKVASELLGPKVGIVSGMALLVDYVLTISISCSHAAKELVGLFHPSTSVNVVVFAVIGIIVLLVMMNLRGVKESIYVMLPIFFVFLATHVIGVFYGIFSHSGEVVELANSTVTEFSKEFKDNSADGFWFGCLAILAMMVPLLTAFTKGAGTFTGIEAVSNSMQILREPREKTAIKTMIMMAISLSFMAAGILICYQLIDVNAIIANSDHGGAHVPYNNILFEEVSKSWGALGNKFVYVAIVSEAFILFVAAQAGFVGGPRMLATMAPDGWVPRWFSRLSNRLVVYDGVWFMGLGAIFFVLITEANVQQLIVMYSINVFITFFITHVGMVVHWWKQKKLKKKWFKGFLICSTGTFLTGLLMVFILFENFTKGAWVAVLTIVMIAIAFMVKAHYSGIGRMIKELNMLAKVPLGNKKPPETVDKKAPTAVVMVSGYNGMGHHALLNIFKAFPEYYKNFVFVSMAVIDFDKFTTPEEVQAYKKKCREDLNQYIAFVNSFGYYGEVRFATGLDSVEGLEKMCQEVAKEYSNCLMFGGQLVFPKENFWTRALHRNATHDLQKRLHCKGIGLMILPVKLDNTL